MLLKILISFFLMNSIYCSGHASFKNQQDRWYGCSKFNNKDNQTCLQCYKNRQLNYLDQSCKCGLGFYDNGDGFDCPACGEGCLKCNSNFQCLQCERGDYQIMGDKCGCPEVGFYIQNKGGQCRSCTGGCLSCRDQICYQCRQGLKRDKQLCLCPEKFIMNSRGYCRECQDVCISDYTSLKCINCLEIDVSDEQASNFKQKSNNNPENELTDGQAAQKIESSNFGKMRIEEGKQKYQKEQKKSSKQTNHKFNGTVPDIKQVIVDSSQTNGKTDKSNLQTEVTIQTLDTQKNQIKSPPTKKETNQNQATTISQKSTAEIVKQVLKEQHSSLQQQIIFGILGSILAAYFKKRNEETPNEVTDTTLKDEEPINPCIKCIMQHSDTKTDCGHFFHLKCLQEKPTKLSQYDYQLKCPSCQSNLIKTKCIKMCQMCKKFILEPTLHQITFEEIENSQQLIYQDKFKFVYRCDYDKFCEDCEKTLYLICQQLEKD